MNRTPQKLINRDQAAKRAGVHVATIDRLRKAGKLKTYRRLGSREVLVSATELDALRVQVVPVQRTAADA